MPEKIIAIYCFVEEMLKALSFRDDPQSQLTTAEIITVALVAAQFFTGNQQASLNFLCSHGYIPALSKSRFNRRLHAVPETLWRLLLWTLAQFHQQANTEGVHIVDTFPVPVCRNIRIFTCRIYQQELFRGYCASKKEFFYGLKVCLVITQNGAPVELTLVPGSMADIRALRAMELDLPEGSTLIGDGGFLDREFEADLQQEAGVRLVVPRRANMKDQLEGCLAYVCGFYRKRVETTFSLLASKLARSIHAVTPRGFELKVFLTVLAFSILG